MFTVNPIKLETGLRPNSAGIPYTLLLRVEAIGFPTFRLLLYTSFPPADKVGIPVYGLGHGKNFHKLSLSALLLCQRARVTEEHLSRVRLYMSSP